MVVQVFSMLMHTKPWSFHNLKKFCRLLVFKFTRTVQKDLRQKILPGYANHRMKVDCFLMKKICPENSVARHDGRLQTK